MFDGYDIDRIATALELRDTFYVCAYPLFVFEEELTSYKKKGGLSAGSRRRSDENPVIALRMDAGRGPGGYLQSTLVENGENPT